MMPSILNMDFSDRTGVGSHKIIWPTIGLAVVAQHTWPYQARIAELWNLQFHIYAFSARVFFARLPVTGMDQLSQRDQMQVMQALNEMQMQESTGFSIGVWWCEKAIGLYCADIRRWWIPTTIWSRSASMNVSQVFARRQGIHGCFYGVSCYHWQQIMEWLLHWLGVPMFRSEVPRCLWENTGGRLWKAPKNSVSRDVWEAERYSNDIPDFCHFSKRLPSFPSQRAPQVQKFMSFSQPWPRCRPRGWKPSSCETLRRVSLRFQEKQQQMQLQHLGS